MPSSLFVRLFGWFVLAILFAQPSRGEEPASSAAGSMPADGAATAAPATMSLALARSRAQAVLEQRCAACHDAARQAAGTAAPASTFDNIFALEDIVREPTLIEPGRPDASRLYQVMLYRHRPLEALKGEAAPSPDEIEQVRDWIEQLPAEAAACPERPVMSENDAAELVRAWKRDMGAAGETRFVTLAHLTNACVSERDLAFYRDEVARAVAALAGRAEPAGVEVIGDLSALVVVRLAEAGLTPDAWSELEAAAPRLIAGAIPADWLADRAGAAAAPRLARRYGDDVSLSRAAWEEGLDTVALREKLGAIEGPDGKIARQLRQGLVTRAQWERLSRVLRGLPPVPDPHVATAGAKLRLGLWSERTVYKVGELASLTAVASGDCYLTLVSIDTGGNATVLFPNDFEQENLMRAGSSITIPLQSATYQLRVKEPGVETAIGICSTTRRRPDGVLHEFERQRFTILGNWRVYLHTADQLEAEITRAAKGRKRNGPAAPSASTAEREARTAIVFRVE